MGIGMRCKDSSLLGVGWEYVATEGPELAGLGMSLRRTWSKKIYGAQFQYQKSRLRWLKGVFGEKEEN